ncbi:hypothetical protein ACIQU5_31995 [Streptomyces sp. NPDC090306]|uniref:hypothetical protein n=1 Tax=Streptomyces sp. NPDC090306 TaxID=3365961 RepID=UPI0037F17286
MSTPAVWMRHPGLPRTQLIHVPESAVPHHQSAGWEIAEAPPAKPKLPPQPSVEATTAAAADGADDAPASDEPADERQPEAETEPPEPAPARKRARKTTTTTEAEES